MAPRTESQEYKGYLIMPEYSDTTTNVYIAAVLKGGRKVASGEGFSWATAFINARNNVDRLLGVEMPNRTEYSVRTPERILPPTSRTAVYPMMPPKTITLQQFQTGWEPKGWNLLVIGPTATWRQEWSDWEAIRDLVQNALDEGETYQYGYDDYGLWIADSGKGINVGDFLLGPPALKPDYARGKFGEGLKVSALVLTRKGYRIRVRTADREIWILYYIQNIGIGQAETLAALWKKTTPRTGTLFNIIGYFGDSFANRFAVNIPKSMILQSTPSTLKGPINRYNMIYRTSPEFPSRLFARDIYLMGIKSSYSYNLWGFDLAPDRHGPKTEEEVSIDMGRTWMYVTDSEMLKYFFETQKAPIADTYENNHLQLSQYSSGKPANDSPSYTDVIKKNRVLWQAAFNKVFGSNAVIQTTRDLNSVMQYFGFTSTSLSWTIRGVLEGVLTTDKSIYIKHQTEMQKVEIVPDEKLTVVQRLNLNLARKIAGELGYGASSKIKAAIIPAAPDGNQIGGVYDKLSREIDVSLSQLETGIETVDTTIHELAHAATGEIDLTHAHNAMCTLMAARIFRLVSQGKFDEVLKDIHFIWER
jgi:hypothetical protein